MYHLDLVQIVLYHYRFVVLNVYVQTRKVKNWEKYYFNNYYYYYYYYCYYYYYHRYYYYRYYRKPYQLLKTLHDMLTIDSEFSRRGSQMMSREGRRSLLTLLREEMSTPWSLLALCRGEVMRILGGKLVSRKVKMLPISLHLKHYLMYDTDRKLDLSYLGHEL